MKRIGGLFPQICTVESLYQAYLMVRKRKRSTRACFEFEKNLASNINALHLELVTGAYAPRPYYTFFVYEPKKRQIAAPAFRDRVVQQAIYNVVMPIFERRFIDQSFACRTGKGTHRASDYAQHQLSLVEGESYILQLDIRKYFFSINRQVLERLLSRVIKDARLLGLMMLFAQGEGEVGVPIGNLLCQLYGLVYLNPLDHFIKRELKVLGYARYVDDFILIGLTRDQAFLYKQEIEAFLFAELGLTLSKHSILRVQRGTNFVGYRTWRTRRFIRKHSLYNFRKAVKKGDLQAVVSILGHARKTASLQYMLTYLKEKDDGLYRKLPKTVRALHRDPAKRPGRVQRTVYPRGGDVCVDCRGGFAA